jgi:dienelactone hydrolase
MIAKTLPAALFLSILTLGAPARAGDAPAAGEALSGKCTGTRLDVRDVRDPALQTDLAGFDCAPIRAAADLATPAPTFAWTARAARSPANRDHEILEVTFPSPLPSGVEADDTVYCRYYPPVIAPGERAPAALVLHHMGGDFGVEAALADFLAQSGVAAIEVEFPFYGPRKPPGSQDRKGLLQANLEGGIQATRQAVADIRRAADWLCARPEVDASRIGCLGVSLGGILGALACGVDPRFTRNALVISGGDLPTILMHESRETNEVRAAFTKRGMGRDEIAAMTRAIDPVRYAARIHTDGLIMLNAKHDEIIPREATEALWNAAGRPRIVWYETGHVTVATCLLDLMRKSRDQFLQENTVPSGN